MATVSWSVTTGGDWNTPADWSTGTVPGIGDDAVLGITGVAIIEYYTVSVTASISVDSITISDTGAVLSVATSGVDAVAADLTNAGDVELQYGATIGLSSDLTNTGVFDVDTQTDYGDNPSGGSSLTIGGTLTNSGSLNIGGAFFGVGLLTTTSTAGAAALDNTGAINLLGNSSVGNTKQAVLDIAAAAPTTWTGSISLSGQSLLEYGSGSIGTVAAGAEIYVASADGYIADAGDTTSNSALTALTSDAGDFELQYGATVGLSGDLTVTGALNIDTQTNYGDTPSGGSSLTIAGTLTNSGGLTIGGAFFGVGQDTATSTVSAAALDNTGAINLVGNSTVGDTKQAVLDIAAAAPTTWTGSISLSGQALLEYGSGEIGTVAAGAEIYLASADGYIADASDTTSNSALSGLTSDAGNFELQYGVTVSLSGALSNTGVLDVDTQTDYSDNPSGGSSLTIAGTLTNSDALNIGNGILTAPTTVNAAALDNTGAINVTGYGSVGTTKQAVLDIAAAAPTTWTGSIGLYGQGLLEYGSGSIGTVAAGAEIYLSTSTGYIADAGAATSNSALSGLTDNAGDFELQYGVTVSVSGDLDNTSVLDVDTQTDYSDNPSGGSSLTIAGTLTNSDALNIGNGILTAPTTVNAAALDNTGAINVTGYGSVGTTKQAVLDIAAAAPTTWTGSIGLYGQGLLEYGSGSIGTVAAGAEIYLSTSTGYIADAGAATSNSALSGLTDNAGDFELQYGVTVSVSGDLDNTSVLDVDTQTDYSDNPSGGSSLTIAGTLTNSDALNIGNGILTAPTTVNAAALDNTGAINVTGYGSVGTTKQAVLDIAAAAPTTWTGSIGLYGQGLLEYGSGSIGTVAAGAEIYLSTSTGYIADAGAATSNSALSGLTDNAGDFELQYGVTVSVSGDLTNTGVLNVDTQTDYGDNPSGGSSLTVAGTLTNSDALNIGNGALTAPTTVNAAALDNTGAISVTGYGSVGTTKQAVLDVTTAAPTTWTGSIGLYGQGLLEYGSGSIGSVAAGAEIYIATSAGYIADAGAATSNSGLSGLTSDAGDFELQYGATVSVSGNLSNTGVLNVDTQTDYGDDPSGGSSLTVAGTLTNSDALNIGNGILSGPTSLSTEELDNGSAGVLNVTGGGSAGVTVSDAGLLANGGDLTIGNNVNASVAGLTNSGTLRMFGSPGVVTDLSVMGPATNSDAMAVGAYAETGVTGAFTDSGALTVGGALDVASGLEVTGSGSLVMQGGDVITPDAAIVTVDAGGTVSGNGALSLGVANSGTMTASGGLLDIAGPISGSGALAIAAASELEIGGATSETVGFNGNVGTVKVDQPLSFAGAFSGLVQGDVIDLVGVQVTGAVVNGSTLTVTAGSQVFTWQVAGSGLSGNTFALEDDQQGGTNLVLGPPGPVISGPNTQTAFLDYPSQFGPLTIADPSAGGGSLTVTITAGTGFLTGMAANAGTLSGSGSNRLTLTGDLADINTMLAGITYGGVSAGATDNVQVVVTDGNNATAAQTIAVTTNTVPYTLPALNAPTDAILLANTPTALGGLLLSDPYAVTTGQQLTFQQQVTSGGPPYTTFELTGPAGPTITGQGTDQLSATGTVNQLNADFADMDVPTAALVVQLYQALLETISLYIVVKKGGQLVNAGIKYIQARTAFQIAQTKLLTQATVDTPAQISMTDEPHIITQDGLIYNFQAVGEFVLAKSTRPGDPFQVQVRLGPVTGSTAASVITQVAAAVGADNVTFGIGRADTVWIDGTQVALAIGASDQRAAGEVTRLSANIYQLIWNTGETLLVTNYGTYLNVGVGLAANSAPGSVMGLIGPSEGQANDFMLPDGTVLQQPLTTAELYTTFANAWRVTQASSLLDYGTGQTTSTFTDLNFPENPITLADLPANVVAIAAQAVAAGGITDPGAAAAAEFDYIVTGGDPNVLAGDESAFQGSTTTQGSITPSGPAPAVLGVIADQSVLPEAQSGSTSVTFDVYLTEAESSDTAVDYTVIAPSSSDFQQQDFGGTFPSGAVTIAAGEISAQFTISLPQGALDALPSKNLELQISTPSAVPILAPNATATIVGTPAQGTPAEPELADLTPVGTFTQVGNAYTLDLGQVFLDEPLPALQFAVVNGASAPADSLSGTFGVATVAGFEVTGANLPSPVQAGSSYDGLTATVNTGLDPTQIIAFGANQETITFTPQDVNATGYSATLPDVTLTINYDLVPPTTINSQAWGDVHIVTYSGLEYNFQAAGEFTLAESNVPGDDFDIQLRLQPYTTSGSVTFIQQVAISLGAGSDVTFSVGDNAPTIVRDNGVVQTFSAASPTLTFSGGTVTEVSPTLFKVAWSTGETMTVTQSSAFEGFNYFNVSDSVPYAAQGSVMGLQGENEGTQNDFQLPNGTVLQQPLTSTELYGEYANAWRVTQTSSLFYYAPGQSFSTFSNPDFPTNPLTLADLPPSVVAQAAQVVAAAGITDPVTAANAELDYIVTGDPSVIIAGQDVQQQVTDTVAPTITETTAPSAAIGIEATQTSVVEASTGVTPVTFTAYLTAAASTDTVVDYAVVSSSPGDLDAADFGGVLPSGTITIAAGQTTGQITIDVPQDALGTVPDANLEVQVSAPGNAVPIFAPTAGTEIVNDQAEAGNAAVPVLTYLGNVGTFTFDQASETYTLNLAGVTQGAALVAAEFGVVNAATAPSDNLSGTFTAPTGTGFTITGDDLTTPLGAGEVYQGLYASVNTAALGANGMSLTFNPVDENASGYSAALTPLTLNIVDQVTPTASAAIDTPTTIIFPNVHVGATDSQYVSFTNTAATGAANLDVTLTPSGDATAAGAISQLAPGATDASDLTAGIDTSSAGALSGSITENLVSDAGGGITSAIASEDPFIDVFGSAYRLATDSVTSNALTVHVDGSGTQSLVVTNTDPNDGYSENLIATVVGVTGAVTASGSTGTIAAQGAGTIAVHFPTTTAGMVGSVTLDLTSDGTGIDGLGTTDLGTVIVPVTVTSAEVPAAAAIEELSGGGTFTSNGAAYDLNLGTITAATTIDLGVLNNAIAPADDLAGSFAVTGDSAFTNSGFDAFSGIASGAADIAPTVTLAPTTTGSFSETITLSPIDTSGTVDLPLGPETLTITGTVEVQGTLAGSLANIGVVDETPLTPFSGLTVIDPGVGDTDTVDLTLANAAFGTLSDLGGGSYDSTTGVYSITGTPSAVTTAIDGLQLTPTTPAANVFLTSTGVTASLAELGAGAETQSAVDASVQQVLGLASVPVGNIAISVSADGTGLAAPTADDTNEAAVTSPTTGDTYTLPTGYQAEYVGGSADATLQDASVGNAVLVGNIGDDVLIGGAANDSIVAGNGNNTLVGGSGTIALVAGDGNDSITTLTDSTYAVTLGGGTDTVFASGSGTITGGSGSDLIDASGTDGTASDTILSQGQQSSVLGGAGELTVLENGAHDTIQAGSGTTTVTLDGSFGRTRGGTGSFTVDDPTANTTVIGGTADTMFVTVGAAASNADVFGRAGNTNILDLGADALMGSGSGTGVVSIAGANTQLYGNESGSGTLNVSIGAANADVFGLNNNTTVDASNAAATGALVYGGFSSVAADNGTLSIQAGADSLVAITGGSNSTINAGTGGLYTFIGTGSLAGSNVINGASASALYVAFIGGAGSATVYGGDAAASLFGVDGTDTTYVNTLAGAPGAFLVANGSAAGGETLNAAGSTANDSLFAAQGNVSLVAGSGTDFLDAAANTGSVGGAGTVVGGDTMVGGGGADLMFFSHGAFEGGAVVINFSSADTIFLSGYNSVAGGNQASMALADATTAGGGTTIALADGTHITFVDTTTAQLQGHLLSD